MLFKQYIVAATVSVLMFLLPLTTQSQTVNEQYDPALAQKLGADEYGMKMYVLVMLKTGSATNPAPEVRDSLFAGHMANIHRLVAEDLMVVAGPMGKNDRYRGLFILNVTTIEAARKLVDTDPAVHGNLLAADYYLWYGSAALQETLTIHEKIEQKKP